MRSHRPTITGTQHMVSSGHYLASLAAHDVLAAGGNAVDAGCAAGIALGVLQSDIVNVAGVAPILVRMADTQQVVSIAGLGWWPRSFDPELFVRDYAGKLPPGVLRTVVPAAPDAWITALVRYGTMRFADVASHAIRLASEGFHMHPLMATTLTEKIEEYSRWPANSALYLPDGRPPEVGALFRQPDLASMLQFMADEDRAAGPSRHAGYSAARRAFYEGDIAARIVAHQESEGGLLSRSDLASYRSDVEDALHRSYFGAEVFSCGPWCQGPMLLQALGVVQKLDLRGIDHNSPAYIHLITEILKRCFWDRDAFFGDPKFVKVPLERLLSDEYAAEILREISPDRATVSPNVPDEIGYSQPGIEPDTSYVCVVDRRGNAFSATPSDGSWHAPIVPGLGIVPSCRGTQSRVDPNHPAGVAPGKRPRLTPNPAMAVRRDGTLIPFGTPGGDVQVQAMIQVILNVFVFEMDIQEAIEAPRFATYSFPSSFYPYEERPGLLKLESRIASDVGDHLLDRGHKVEWWPEWTWLAGGVCMIAAAPERRQFRGGADPRRPSYAVGW